MPKEKSVNPAQAQRKAEKAKAIKKGTALHSLIPFPPLTETPQAKQKQPRGATKSSRGKTQTVSKNSSMI
jgi:WW domain binding protein 11